MTNCYGQFRTPLWWPICLRLGGRHGFAFLNLPADLSLAWNMELEPEERLVRQWGKLTLTRLETEEEEEERLDAEAEASYEDQVASFYSY